MTVLGSNFIHHKRWIPFFHPWSIYFYSSMETRLCLRSPFLRFIYVSARHPVASYRTWNPRLSRTPFELSRERERDCSTCPGGESVPAGTANFLEFSKGSISISSNLDYRWRCRNSHTFDANVNLSSLDSRALREEIVFY